MIVDTNGLSAWWINEPSFIRQIEQADCLCVPVPALAEFRFGILKSRFCEKMTTWLDDALTARQSWRPTTVLPATMRRYGFNSRPQARPFR
jgi:predicted nucleic acid-binding protein